MTKQVSDILDGVFLRGWNSCQGMPDMNQPVEYKSPKDAAQALLNHLKAQTELSPLYGPAYDTDESRWAASGAVAATNHIIAMLERELGNKNAN